MKYYISVEDSNFNKEYCYHLHHWMDYTTNHHWDETWTPYSHKKELSDLNNILLYFTHVKKQWKTRSYHPKIEILE